MTLGLIPFIIVVLIVVALLVWAVQLVTILQPPINQIIMALIVVLGALAIADRAGVF